VIALDGNVIARDWKFDELLAANEREWALRSQP